LLAACSDTGVHVESATPGYGPLGGGTRITLDGTGFSAATRVLVGEREAPLAAASHDGRKLDVVIPPGVAPGPATLTIVDGSTAVTRADLFRYVTTPTISDASPAKIIPGGVSVMTLTGSGFADSGAGMVTVLVDGTPAMNVAVSDDNTLSFTVPDGPMLVQPTIQVLDDRGSASLDRAFRYVPSANRGLLLFPNYTGELAEFFDLVDHKIYSIPRPISASYRYSSVYVDARGDIWAIDRYARFGRIDTHTGQIASPVPLTHTLPAMTRVGSTIYALERGYTLGTLDPSTGNYAAINSQVSCCGSYGLASDGDTIYATWRVANVPTIHTYDPASNTFSAGITLTGGSPSFAVEELRVIDHVLYAISRDGTLCTIDPTSGAVTVVASINRASAFDLLP
jgi:hypothetical protein